jgi:hypothetical protein
VRVSFLRKCADRYSVMHFDGSQRFAVRLPLLRRFAFFAAGMLKFENLAVNKSIAALAQQSAEVTAILGYARERLVAACF